MDMHLPKVPHGWREVAKEIAIVFAGVLIALYAQQVVDDWQWRAKVHTAEAAMQRELFYETARRSTRGRSCIRASSSA